jgi:hypothetical protein
MRRRRRTNPLSPAQAERERAALMREVARELKRKDRRKLVALKAELVAARRQRRSGVREARALCRSRKKELPTLAQLAAELRKDKARAKAECASDLAAARVLRDRESRKRAELAAEQTHQQSIRRLDRLHRERTKSAKRPGLRKVRSESDDDVRHNIPPELVALFERVKRQIKGSDRETRTEAFLKYAEEHPDEEWAALEGAVDREIREMERRQAMPNPKKKKKRAKSRRPKKKRRAAVTVSRTVVRVNAKKRAKRREKTGKAAHRKARARKTNSVYESRDAAALRSAILYSLSRSPHNDPPAKCSAAYWRLPRRERAVNLRRLARGDMRSRRTGACIAKAEAARGGPPKRNPAMSDREAIREYERTHWGDRGRQKVRGGHAPDPSHGTLTKMGKLVAVTYETRKRGDGGTAHYEHAFEGPLPTLAYNEGGLIVVGGAYTVRKGGITG